MFSMQKIAVLALALALGMVAVPRNASAQDATSGSATGGPGGGRGGRGMGGGGGRGGYMFKAATDLTDLTADQKEKIAALQKEQTDKTREMFQKMSEGGGQPSQEDRTALREKMTGMSKEYQDKIAAILTPEQKTKFEEAMKAQPQGRWGGNRGTSGTADAKPEPKADAAPKADAPKAETK